MKERQREKTEARWERKEKWLYNLELNFTQVSSLTQQTWFFWSNLKICVWKLKFKNWFLKFPDWTWDLGFLETNQFKTLWSWCHLKYSIFENPEDKESSFRCISGIRSWKRWSHVKLNDKIKNNWLLLLKAWEVFGI